MMGSGGEVVHEAVEALVARGEKVGMIKVRLYRLFSTEHFVKALHRICRWTRQVIPNLVRPISTVEGKVAPGWAAFSMSMRCTGLFRLRF
jgi:hypothetical protein